MMQNIVVDKQNFQVNTLQIFFRAARNVDSYTAMSWVGKWKSERSFVAILEYIIIIIIIIIFNLRTAALRLIVRSGLDVPTFATRRLQSTQRRKVELWARNVREFCLVGPVGPTRNTTRQSPRYGGKTRGCHCSHWAPDDGRENARNMLSCK
jgi:hypothetical protein